MDAIIFTPRLKVTLMQSAKRGSQELEWLHELRSDYQVTFWSIHGQAKTIEDTERFANNCLPAPVNENDTKPKSYKVVYAIHEILSPKTQADNSDAETRFIGLVSTRSLGGPHDLILPTENIDPTSQDPNVLSIEIGYQFLPRSWGKGYATEAVSAVLEAHKRGREFWKPYEKVYLRAIVNHENEASQAVMKKVGIQDMGIWVWKGEPVFLAGRWIEESKICCYGMYLIE